MSLQQMFTKAVELHMQGRLEEARQQYDRVLAEVPDNINVLGNIGVVCRDLGLLDEALDYCRKAAAAAPHDPTQHINLGAVYEARGDLSQARASYSEALKCAPEHPKALNNLGKIFHMQGETARALDYLEKAVTVEPDYPLALNNLGVLLSERGDIEAARQYLEKSRRLDPDNAETLYNLAGIYNCLEEKENAIDLLKGVLRISPDHASARHMLAALTGVATETAPKQYVVETFDRYAPRFDEHLQGALGYNVPEALAAMLEEVKGDITFTACLDLGCGTGLSAVPFKKRMQRCVGVDLSSQMLARARQKDIYTRLECADIFDFFVGCREGFDLFLATDLFIYLGRLDEFFVKLSEHALPGAVIACSIELHEGDEEYVLRESGRYAHSRKYVVACAGKAGFSLLQGRAHTIRQENSVGIEGELLLFALSNGPLESW